MPPDGYSHVTCRGEVRSRAAVTAVRRGAFHPLEFRRRYLGIQADHVGTALRLSGRMSTLVLAGPLKKVPLSNIKVRFAHVLPWSPWTRLPAAGGRSGPSNRRTQGVGKQGEPEPPGLRIYVDRFEARFDHCASTLANAVTPTGSQPQLRRMTCADFVIAVTRSFIRRRGAIS